jgi:hypothetical protein
MEIEQVRGEAFAMPLMNPAFPPGPYSRVSSGTHERSGGPESDHPQRGCDRRPSSTRLTPA